MVARTVRDREVVGSNPAAPTIKKDTFCKVSFLLVILKFSSRYF